MIEVNANKIKEIMGIDTITSGSRSEGTADVTIIIGTDYIV